MKKNLSSILLILSLIVTILLSSCATAITVGKSVSEYKLQSFYKRPQMDFIGFKIDTNILSTTGSSKVSVGVWIPTVDNVMTEFDQAKAISQTKSLRQLGYTLETNGIANNKSDSYFGIYSLQEMELYKSDSRYVTFVEVAQSKLDYKDNKGSKNILGITGGSLLGVGAPFLITGAAFSGDEYVGDLSKTYMAIGGICAGISVPFLIAALTPTKTEINFSGIYNVYLYDTETKSLIRKDAVSVQCSEKFNGSYTYDDSSKEIVRDFISKNVYNELLKEFETLNNWLSSSK